MTGDARDDPSTWRRVLAAIGGTLLAAAAAEVLARLLPAKFDSIDGVLVVIPAAVAIAFAAKRGLRVGLAGGVVAFAYTVAGFVAGGLMSPGDPIEARASVGVATGFAALALVTLVGALADRAAQSADRAVTAERMRAQALNDRNYELTAANRVLTDFAHVVAHDLKEPVRALAALHDALVEDASDRLTEDERALLAQLRRADRRLAALVDALLEYARATRIDLDELRPVNVARVLEGDVCATRFAGLLAERGATLVAPDESAPDVRGTPAAIALVLGNLVTNAIRHNPSDRPLVRVSATRADDESGIVDVVVEDNGRGFSEATVNHVRAIADDREPPVSLGGSGFGLLIVERAVERLGGRLRLGSSPEGGAAVHVLLPAAEVRADAAREDAPDRVQPERRGSASGRGRAAGL